MKNKIFITLLAASMLLSASALQAFEGKVNLKVINGERGSEPRNVTVYAKNELIRADFTLPAGPRGRKIGPVISLINRSKHEATMLFVNRKVYVTGPLPQNVADIVAGDFSQTLFKPTGRTAKIAGIDAHEYTGTAENNKYTEMWVTEELGRFLLDKPGMGEISATGGLIEQTAWTKFAYSQNFFVLRVIERDSKIGPEIFRMDVTKIDPAKQPDSLFTIPEGYKKIEPREMMR